ncbi:DUF5998 family protein [Brachybacterium phenoliresistens]|uniref:Phosphodiesterase n=1 Tax=Brachybacterium phenoliresistens TaxID=396014 RepID=Z9JXF9_9MICO|nr:DUF5998 family protein [Brachybacterium phenoliresistens]EWS82879.1 hypothetical protein BF93_07615 [Brachybacterium phenoliresistens]
MTSALPADLASELEASGYFPQTAAACVARALRGAPVRAHLVRPETTFDGSEVRRHLTVLALTERHLVISHIDDESADELNPPQVVATTEKVRLDRIGTTGLTQVFAADDEGSGVEESEVTLGISWGGSRRIDLERAWCEDPNCQADHGYTGTLAPSDLALRISALADGPLAVAAAIAFHERLMDAVDELEA